MKGLIEIHYKETRKISEKDKTKEVVHKKLISINNSLNSVDDDGTIYYDCGSKVKPIETYEEIKKKIEEAQ